MEAAPPRLPRSLRHSLLGLGILAFLLAGCSSDDGSPASTLLGPQTYGTGDGAYTISFTKTPTSSIGYARARNWFGGDVSVTVMSHPDATRPGRSEALLRSYLPIATGGRMYLFDGMPAVKEVLKCNLPSGPCPGMTAGLEVFDGPRLFDVFVTGLDDAATRQALARFRVASVPRTSGCSYAVSRSGFSQHCP